MASGVPADERRIGPIPCAGVMAGTADLPDRAADRDSSRQPVTVACVRPANKWRLVALVRRRDLSGRLLAGSRALARDRNPLDRNFACRRNPRRHCDRTRRDSPGAQVLSAGLTCPLMMPGLVLGIALLQYFRASGPDPDLAGVAACPYRRHAAFCGAHDDRRTEPFRLHASRRSANVRMRLLRFHLSGHGPSARSRLPDRSAVSFLASMDNYPVSIFLDRCARQNSANQDAAIIEEIRTPRSPRCRHSILIATLALLVIADRASAAPSGRTGGVKKQWVWWVRRDFRGYGRTKPKAEWPDGARVAVSFVVNFEEGAEYAISDGDDRNEAIYEVEPFSGRRAGSLRRQPFRIWCARWLVANHGAVRRPRRQGDGQRLRARRRALA